MNSAQHRQKRADLINKAQQLNTEHIDDEGFLASEKQEEFDRMMADAARHKSEADRLDALEAAAASLDEDVQPPQPGQPRKPEAVRKIEVRSGTKNGKPRYVEVPVGALGSKEYQEAYWNYIRTGERSAALQTDNATQAGYLVADQVLAAGILKEADDAVFIRRNANVTTLMQSKSLGIKKRTTRASTWGWGAEIQAPTADSSLAYGKKVLEPHYAAGSVLVSNDWMMNAPDAQSEVVYEMGQGGGELMEDAYLTGDGVQKPLGVFVASSDGISTSRDVLTGATDDFTFAQLVAAKYTLKATYRSGNRGGARWMFHRDGISKIAQLVDGNSQPIFRVGAGVAQDGGPPEDTLLGYPVDESERAPNTFTASQYVGILCNWSYYRIVDGLDMSFQRLNELNARTNQVEFLARLKTDGMPVLEEAFVRLKTDAS